MRVTHFVWIKVCICQMADNNRSSDHHCEYFNCAQSVLSSWQAVGKLLLNMLCIPADMNNYTGLFKGVTGCVALLAPSCVIYANI